MGFPPIHPKTKQSTTNIQNNTLEKVLNNKLLIATFKYKGNNKSTTIEDKRAITPINLSGIDRKIA